MKKEKTDESESNPPACEVPACVLITCLRFASVSNSFFLLLILRESTFQCPISLQKAHWFIFRSLKPGLNLDLSLLPLPFQLEALPLTINVSVDVCWKKTAYPSSSLQNLQEQPTHHCS